MKTFEISGESRAELGKKGAKLVRKEEKVPCVMYGGEKVIHFAVPAKSIAKLVNTPTVYIVVATIDGVEYKAIIQDAQYHPVTDAAIHMDFFQVTDDKPVSMNIPVVLTGFSVGVQAGGKIQLVMRKLKVKAMIADLPETLDIDVTDLDLGKTIKVGELSYDNIELLAAPNSVVAAVKLTRAARGAAAAAAAAEEN